MLKKTVILLLIINFTSCEELIEVDDITNDAINILAPSDNISLETTTINFSWQPLEFAESYHFQIATPNFDVPQDIVEDTLVNITSYSKILSEGDYQWRVKAINFAYETQYSTQSLTIED